MYTLLTPFTLIIFRINFFIFIQLITINTLMLIFPFCLFFIQFYFPRFFQTWLTNNYVFSHWFTFIKVWLFYIFLNYVHISFIFGYFYTWLHDWVFYYCYWLFDIDHYLIFYHPTLFLLCFSDLRIGSHISNITISYRTLAIVFQYQVKLYEVFT